MVGGSVQEQEEDPWAMHLSLLKPHPPLIAPHPYNTLYPLDAVSLPQHRAVSSPPRYFIAAIWVAFFSRRQRYR